MKRNNSMRELIRRGILWVLELVPGGHLGCDIRSEKAGTIQNIPHQFLCEQHASLACELAPQMLLQFVCFSRSTSQKVCAHSWKATLGDITYSSCYLSQVSDSRSSFHPRGSLAFIAFQSRGSYNKGSGYEAEKYERLRGRLTMLFSGDLWPSLGN